MQAVADALSTGSRRVVLEAVPGAGKTRLLLKAARCEPSLLLAYNTQLAESMQERLAMDDECTATCLTFHALCARCLGGPIRDDHQMEQMVHRAERGQVTPVDVPSVTRVLIDEAQDVRELYVRLIRVLGLARTGVSLLVAGDSNQLVYDFDDDFPASLDALQQAGAVFGGGDWTSMQLQESHRLTTPMANFINEVFETSIVSNKMGPLVEVRSPRSMFALYGLLKDILEEEKDVLLLVDRRQGNRPLRALLNAISRNGGRRLKVHGIDPETKPGEGGHGEPSNDTALLTCASFWSAKGLECDVAVVLLPEHAPRNATYVALTRAKRRLVVVIDPREPHTAVCRIAGGSGSVFVSDATARKAIQSGAESDTACSFLRRQHVRGVNVARFVPSRSTLLANTNFSSQTFGDCEGELSSWSRIGNEECDMSAVVVAMALVMAESKACDGKVRAFEDVLHPARMNASQARAATALGFMGRHAPASVPDDALLASDLRTMATKAYADLSTVRNVALVALAIRAWDAFDHTMRRLLPVEEWTDDNPALEHVLHRITRLLPMREVQYDHVLKDAHSELHSRVHAMTKDTCFHVVWLASSDDFAMASVRAALHPRHSCTLVELANDTVRIIVATESLLADETPVLSHSE